MYIQRPHDFGAPLYPDDAADLLVGQTKDGKSDHGGWSSLIGVVTAICGNILISFALNTQRYAHMRLSRDREAALQEKRKAARRKASQNGSYGTQQNEIAEERARKNADSSPDGFMHGDPEAQAGETSPLIPKLGPRQTSGLSSDTATPDERIGAEGKEKSYLKSPIWWLGISLMVLGEIGNFLAYGFAPASIVSPLGVVALVSNCIIAPLLLGEHFRWRDALGVIIAIGGCVVVVLSASASNPKLTPGAIWRLVTTWEFETYLGITIFLIIVLAIGSNKYGQKSILIDLGLVGLFGGYTALSTKGVASLLTYSIWRVVTFPITYLLVAVLVFTAVMQIKYVNRALQRFNATMVIPTQFVLFTISVILGSAVLYRDFERESTEDGIKFVAGCALTFFGVWCITSGRKSEQPDQDDVDEDDDVISLRDGEAVTTNFTEDGGIETTGNGSIAAASRAQVPSIQRYHTADTVILFVPKTAAPNGEPPTPGDSDAKPLEEQLEHVPPAVTSAVHTTSAAPMFEGSSEDPHKKPPLHATTSEPVIPTTPGRSGGLRPKTPLMRTPSGPEGQPRLSPVHRSHDLQPNSSQRLLNPRQSIVDLIPGPLTSPLSGSLSAIVADELRRGVEKSPFSSLRRRKTPTPSATKRPTDLHRPATSSSLKRHSISSGTGMDLESGEAAELRRAAGSPPNGRVRSLSATLSDIFGTGSGTLRRQRTLEQQERRRLGETGEHDQTHTET